VPAWTCYGVTFIFTINIIYQYPSQCSVSITSGWHAIRTGTVAAYQTCTRTLSAHGWSSLKNQILKRTVRLRHTDRFLNAVLRNLSFYMVQLTYTEHLRVPLDYFNLAVKSLRTHKQALQLSVACRSPHWWNFGFVYFGLSLSLAKYSVIFCLLLPFLLSKYCNQLSKAVSFSGL